eukprot:3136146-Rhodomonas_salina.1
MRHVPTACPRIPTAERLANLSMRCLVVLSWRRTPCGRTLERCDAAEPTRAYACACSGLFIGLVRGSWAGGSLVGIEQLPDARSTATDPRQCPQHHIRAPTPEHQHQSTNDQSNTASVSASVLVPVRRTFPRIKVTATPQRQRPFYNSQRTSPDGTSTHTKVYTHQHTPNTAPASSPFPFCASGASGSGVFCGEREKQSHLSPHGIVWVRDWRFESLLLPPHLSALVRPPAPTHRLSDTGVCAQLEGGGGVREMTADGKRECAYEQEWAGGTPRQEERGWNR